MKPAALVVPLRVAEPAPLTLAVVLPADAQLRLVEAIADAVAERTCHAVPAPALLDRSGLAQALGVSPATVDRLTHRGMPFVRLIEARRYALPDVVDWLKAREQAK